MKLASGPQKGSKWASWGKFWPRKGSNTRDFSHIWAEMCEKSRVFDTFWRAGRTKHSEGPKTRASQRQKKNIKNSMFFTIWVRKIYKTLCFPLFGPEKYQKLYTFCASPPKCVKIIEFLTFFRTWRGPREGEGNKMRYGARKGAKTLYFSHIWAEMCEKSRVFNTFWRAGRTKHSEGAKTRASRRQKNTKNSWFFTIFRWRSAKKFFFTLVK